jgi:hypothetical protein
VGNCSELLPPLLPDDGFRRAGDCCEGEDLAAVTSLRPTSAGTGERRTLLAATSPATAVDADEAAEDNRRRGRGMGRRPLVAAAAASVVGDDNAAAAIVGGRRPEAENGDEISPSSWVPPAAPPPTDVREGFATRGFGSGSEIIRKTD